MAMATPTAHFAFSLPGSSGCLTSSSSRNCGNVQLSSSARSSCASGVVSVSSRHFSHPVGCSTRKQVERNSQHGRGRHALTVCRVQKNTESKLNVGNFDGRIPRSLKWRGAEDLFGSKGEFFSGSGIFYIQFQGSAKYCASKKRLRQCIAMAADYYSTLGVSKSATKQEIKSAYRKLARQVLNISYSSRRLLSSCVK